MNLDYNIDYNAINKKLDEEIFRCKNIIKSVLFNNYSNNENAGNYKNKNLRIKFNSVYLSHSLKFLLYSVLYLIASKKKSNIKSKLYKYKSIVSWF